ncbi:hypothetical protein D9757_007610 [Collybiopsis confluens]|uniref:Uncharacterized protein n=1 Tax=Collybiopsis confluens TaxID=2823264 RepID=A0A8H5H9Q9_9AGAR|nr:hypothetical protein D9757_007610 [Collybiopsis confluens]
MQSAKSPPSNSSLDETSQPGPSVPISGPSPHARPISSGTPQVLPSAAAARKKKLEDDPWSTDICLQSVKCLNCGHCVRLSTKSLFDNHHWIKHKERCIPKGDRRKKKDHPPSSSTSSASNRPRKAQAYKAPPRIRRVPHAKPSGYVNQNRAVSVSSSISSLTPISTPPLTSDNEEDLYSAEETESLPVPPPPLIPLYTTSKKCDNLTEQYLARAHGIQIHSPWDGPSPPNSSTVSSEPSLSGSLNTSDDAINWRSWDWSQLRMADFKDQHLSDEDEGETLGTHTAFLRVWHTESESDNRTPTTSDQLMTEDGKAADVNTTGVKAADSSFSSSVASYLNEATEEDKLGVELDKPPTLPRVRRQMPQRYSPSLIRSLHSFPKQQVKRERGKPYLRFGGNVNVGVNAFTTSTTSTAITTAEAADNSYSSSSSSLVTSTFESRGNTQFE